MNPLIARMVWLVVTLGLLAASATADPPIDDCDRDWGDDGTLDCPNGMPGSPGEVDGNDRHGDDGGNGYDGGGGGVNGNDGEGGDGSRWR